MSDAVIVAITAVGVAAINMIGSVLLMWIRAHYRWTNGHTTESRSSTPASP